MALLPTMNIFEIMTELDPLFDELELGLEVFKYTNEPDEDLFGQHLQNDDLFGQHLKSYPNDKPFNRRDLFGQHLKSNPDDIPFNRRDLFGQHLKSYPNDKPFDRRDLFGQHLKMKTISDGDDFISLRKYRKTQ